MKYAYKMPNIRIFSFQLLFACRYSVDPPTRSMWRPIGWLMMSHAVLILVNPLHYVVHLTLRMDYKGDRILLSFN